MNYDVLIINKNHTANPEFRINEVLIINAVDRSRIRVSSSFYLEMIGVSPPGRFRTEAQMTQVSWVMLEETAPGGVEEGIER